MAAPLANYQLLRSEALPTLAKQNKLNDYLSSIKQLVITNKKYRFIFKNHTNVHKTSMKLSTQSTMQAGLVTENGDSFIPASQRPDGTWRKARRVKEGYVPQEEVPLYESKGKQFVNRQSGNSRTEPLKLPSGHTAHVSIPGLFLLEEGEKEKKSGKKKKSSTNNACKVEDVGKQLQSVKISKEMNSKVKGVKKEEAACEVDLAKKLKNLRKKLREIETLEEKIKKKEIAKPEPEQLQKVKRKGDLLMEIRQLENKT